MTLVSKMTAKQLRSIRRDIKIIFSKKGVTFPKTTEEFKELGMFPPKIVYKNKDIYLSKLGIDSLKRITTFICEIDEYSVLLDFSDVFKSVKTEIDHWISNDSIPDENEFLVSLEKRLCASVDIFTYLCKIDGIAIDGLASLKLGNKTIEVFSNSCLSNLKLPFPDLYEIVDKEYSGSLVIKGEERGSGDVSLSRFYFHCESYLSLLSVYSCAIYKEAITRAKILLVNNCSIAWGPASTVGWRNSDCNVVFKRYFKSAEDINFDKELLDYLNSTCFFSESASLIEKQQRNELEEAVVKAVYWFGEAQRDQFGASKWIKLWTCLECFFTLKSDSDKITESNARGIASLLLFGGYNIDEFGDYSHLKSKIKQFYSSRSKIIHNADYAHIDGKSLRELSYMVAWVIIVVVSLLTKGYSTKPQIKEQADRFDKITIKPSGREKLRR